MKGWIVFVVVLVVLAGIIFGLMAMGTYNGAIEKKNSAIKAWDDVEAAYQRRLDTIPKFAKNAQFSADFQKKLALDYAKAREGIKEAAGSISPEALQKAANEKFNGLMIAVRQEAVVEAKLDQLTELNAEIENIERVINHERKAYNDGVRVYNNAVQTFPGAWFISVFGWSFPAMDGFKSELGAEKSPDYELKVK